MRHRDPVHHDERVVKMLLRPGRPWGPSAGLWLLKAVASPAGFLEATLQKPKTLRRQTLRGR